MRNTPITKWNAVTAASPSITISSPLSDALSRPVSTLKNVGPKRLAQLNRLGIFTLGDIICHYPRDYKDRTLMAAPSGVKPGEINTVLAEVNAPARNINENGRLVTVLTLSDGKGVLEAVWYNQPYMRYTFKKDDQLALTGLVKPRSGKAPRMASPDYEKLGNGESLSFGRIIPVYRLAEKLSQKLLRGLIKSALDATQGELDDALPPSVLETYGLCGKGYAALNIHFPQSGDAFFNARKRLVFEELLVMQAALFRLKGIFKTPSPAALKGAGPAAFLAKLPFALTAAQGRALHEIMGDMGSGYVMNRLVQGDVGSGKTAVALAAAYATAADGGQAALMAPTEVLAAQHYDKCRGLFAGLGVDVCLLTGALPTQEKRTARRRTERGECGLVIGTHALISDSTVFRDLRLVITDEQHRFGVRQRAKLAGKGHTPHVLVMSATPIPRTLALILYGDMDISIIDELPPGRLPVDTYAVNSGYRSRLLAFIGREAEAGRQAYIVCPLIEDTGKSRGQAVRTYVENARQALPGLAVECLHGRMKPDVKADVMSRFARGGIDVVVSTTVVEVGVDVPNATVMVVENAERFGLSQLHQLRGRVGRGGDRSYCVLVTDSDAQVCRERMKAMTGTNDGFVISERDLTLRGPGDFFGLRQHGLPEMGIANLYRDMDILKLAQQCASGLLADDPLLEKPENQPLAREVNRFLDRCGKDAGL